MPRERGTGNTTPLLQRVDIDVRIGQLDLVLVRPGAARPLSLEELANLSDRGTGTQSWSSVTEPKRSDPSVVTTISPRTAAPPPPTAATVTTA